MRYMINTGHAARFDKSNLWINGESSLHRLVDASLIDFVVGISSHQGLIDTESVEDPEQRHSLEKALALLEEAGALVPLSSAQAIPKIVLNLYNYCEGLRSHSDIQARLDSARVHIVYEEEESLANSLSSALERQSAGTGLSVTKGRGISDSEEIDRQAIVLAIAAVDGDRFLDYVNHWALENGLRIWLPIVPPVGTSYQVGPWIYPESSACYQCYRLRKASVTMADNSIAPDLGTRATPFSQSLYDDDPLLTQILVNTIARSVVMHLGLDGLLGQAPHGYVAHFQNSMEGYSVDNHYVLRVPRCESCSPTAGTGYPQIWFHGEAE